MPFVTVAIYIMNYLGFFVEVLTIAQIITPFFPYPIVFSMLSKCRPEEIF
jgi:hypothetical protein